MPNQAKNSNNKLTLLIDTSKRMAQVALIKEGKIMDSRKWKSEKQIGIHLLEQIDEMLEKNDISLNDIDRVAVYAGPGHFSALRSGIVTATMLAEANTTELVSVKGDDLATMISEAIQGKVVDIIDPVYSS